MLLTVITVVKNGQEHIEECLNSINSLKYKPNIEHLIVDGNSVDSTLAICKKYDCKIITQSGKGIYSAMNEGVRESKGHFVVFVNSDDFVDIKGLEKAYEIISQDMDMEHLFSIRTFKDDGSIRIWNPKSTINRKYAMPAPHPGMIIRRSLMENELCFSESLRSGADYKMATRLVEMGNYKCHDNVISNFRLGGVSSKFDSVLENNSVRAKIGTPLKYRVLGFIYDVYQYFMVKIS